MNGFRLLEYLKYCRVARGRHGVHSPAVYRFIDECLRPAERHFNQPETFMTATGEIWAGDRLMRRIVHHFRCREIILLSSGGRQISYIRKESPDTDERLPEPYERLYIWPQSVPETWASCLDKPAAPIGLKDLIVVPGIHDSAAHLAAWDALCARPEVRLSIDLFRLGLLFFAEEFKERQHFVLKFPV